MGIQVDSPSSAAGPKSLSIAFDPAVPLHHQVYLELRRQIADGLWQGRTDFPGERELADQLGISVITTRAALDRLSSDGWIERRRGRRPQILHRPDEPAAPHAELEPSMIEYGPFRPYTYRVLLAEVSIVPAEACAAFGLAAGEELWQCMRLRSYAGRPHSVTHNVQDLRVGERHTKKQLQQDPMAHLLTGQGLVIARIRRRMRIASAPATATEALGLNLTDQVLMATFTEHGPDQSILEWVRIYLHPDQSTPEETLDLGTGTWSAIEPL